LLDELSKLNILGLGIIPEAKPSGIIWDKIPHPLRRGCSFYFQEKGYNSMLQDAILGIVQGLTEFLPISSSGHLILIPWLLNWADPGLTFDIALHVGTLIAVVLYFWRDWLTLIRKGLLDYRSTEGKLFWYLVVATIPGALCGYLLEKKAETIFRSPALIATMLIIFGLVLYFADRKGKQNIDVNGITLKTSLFIGLAQMLAIIPGVSRSGITMTTGLLLGLTRSSAARFSFLLSTPIIFGAALVKMPRIIANPSMVDINFIIGVVASFITGIATIGFLLRYVQTKSFQPFVWYRILLGLVVIGFVLLR
jgi:undecaprenyl-diphosphatase